MLTHAAFSLPRLLLVPFLSLGLITPAEIEDPGKHQPPDTKAAREPPVMLPQRQQPWALGTALGEEASRLGCSSSDMDLKEKKTTAKVVVRKPVVFRGRPGVATVVSRSPGAAARNASDGSLLDVSFELLAAASGPVVPMKGSLHQGSHHAPHCCLVPTSVPLPVVLHSQPATRTGIRGRADPSSSTGETTEENSFSRTCNHAKGHSAFCKCPLPFKAVLSDTPA